MVRSLVTMGTLGVGTPARLWGVGRGLEKKEHLNEDLLLELESAGGKGRLRRVWPDWEVN
jgi:hypothetical protein